METILIVEDDRTYARATANWLARNGMDTRYVLSADAAKEFLGSHEAALVLSDFRLGDCNGVELLEWMRAHGYRMPFLVMTGYGDISGAVEAVKKGIGSDTRIGKKFLNAGCGYGGSCFPKDVKALIRTGDDHGHSLELLKAVERVNENQKSVLFRKITSRFGKELKGRRFAMWGLAFKPGTDDMREAPSLVLIEKLLEAGAVVRAFDPVAVEECKRRIGNRIEYADNMYDALEGADALIVVTEWAEFKIPKFTFIEKALKHKIIFDGRNIYNPEQMQEFGYEYYGIGRKTK